MANDARRLQVSTVPQAILVEQSTPPEDQKAAKDIAAVLVVAGDAEASPRDVDNSATISG